MNSLNPEHRDAVIAAVAALSNAMKMLGNAVLTLGKHLEEMGLLEEDDDGGVKIAVIDDDE